MVKLNVHPSRSGVTIVEVLVAIFVAASTAVMAAQMVLSSLAQRANVREQTLAYEELANAAQRLSVAPIDSLEETAGDWPLSKSAAEQLPQAAAAVVVAPDDDATRITITITWRKDTPQERTEFLVLWRLP